VRCQECEEKREIAQQDRARLHGMARDEASLFPDMTGSQ
jgi:hypothetical protein